MAKKPDEDLQRIRDLIRSYHGDTKARTASQCKAGLEEISADVEGMLMALEEEGVE